MIENKSDKPIAVRATAFEDDVDGTFTAEIEVPGGQRETRVPSGLPEYQPHPTFDLAPGEKLLYIKRAYAINLDEDVEIGDYDENEDDGDHTN